MPIESASACYFITLSSHLPYQLFNMAVDEGETTDVSALWPDIVESLSALATAAHVDNPLFPVGDGVCVSS